MTAFPWPPLPHHRGGKPRLSATRLLLEVGRTHRLGYGCSKHRRAVLPGQAEPTLNQLHGTQKCWRWIEQLHFKCHPKPWGFKHSPPPNSPWTQTRLPTHGSTGESPHSTCRSPRKSARRAGRAGTPPGRRSSHWSPS